MSPETDDGCGHAADSAGVPWEGRSFESNPHAGDDGSADPALLAALEAFRVGAGDAVAVVEAYRTARLLIPLVPEKGDEGIGPTGLRVDKTQELSIVTVAAPDGRRVLPVFTSVAALARWDSVARPVPADGVRTAMAAASDDTDLIVIDPGSETEFVLRRPAVWAIGQGLPWEPAPTSPEVFTALQASIGGRTRGARPLGRGGGSRRAHARTRAGRSAPSHRRTGCRRARRRAVAARFAVGCRRSHRGARRLADGQAGARVLTEVPDPGAARARNDVS